MESTPNQEIKKTPHRAKMRKTEISEKEAEEMKNRHEEVPVRGLAKPEVSPEYMADVQERLQRLREERQAQMAKDRNKRDVDLIDRLKDEIKGLEALAREHGIPPKPERKPTIRTINLQIETLDQKLKEAVDRRLSAIRSTDSAALKAVQKEIGETRDELTKLRAEREALREQNKTFVKERMREALAHYESSKEERARHKKLAESGVTLDKLKEQELDRKDMERWNALLALDAEQTRKTEDYQLLRSNFEALEPEAVSTFMENLRAEAKTGNLDIQHAAAQIVADIEAGKIVGFTEVEAKFFAASEEEAHERAEAIETMGAEMTPEEAVAEWEKIKKRSSKGEAEARLEEQAFIDYLHKQYPDYIHFTGKEYEDAQTSPEKIGFFKKLFSFGKPKTRLQEMEEALDNVPNIGKLAGRFLMTRKIGPLAEQKKPLSVKMR